jgi:hypothetical protein
VRKKTLEQSCSKAPTNHKKHIKREKDGKLERVESFKKPLLAMITCFKIKVA